MTNSDNLFGTYNKMTRIITQHTWEWDGSTQDDIIAQSWDDVAAAKAYVYTDAALALFEACGTNLQWAIVDDAAGGTNNSLKWTIDFGIVANPDTKSHSAKFREDKQTLLDADGWYQKKYLATAHDGTDLDSAGNVTDDGSDNQCPRQFFSIQHDDSNALF